MKVTISKSRKIDLFLGIVIVMGLAWFFAVKPIKAHPLARRIMNEASRCGFSPDASLVQYYSLTNDLTEFKSLRRFGIVGTLNQATNKRQRKSFYANFSFHESVSGRIAGNRLFLDREFSQLSPEKQNELASAFKICNDRNICGFSLENFPNSFRITLKYYSFGTLDAVFSKSGDMLYLQEYAKKGVTPRGDIVKKVTDDIYLVTDRR